MVFLGSQPAAAVSDIADTVRRRTEAARCPRFQLWRYRETPRVGMLALTELALPGDSHAGRASELVQRYFGDTAPFAILLQGPPAELDRQGPALIRKLRSEPAVTTVSPWDKGSVGDNSATLLGRIFE